MKRYFFLTLILLLLASPVLASTQIEFTKTDVAAATWYIGQWDKLAFDVKIPANAGKTDILNAITIQNLGNASPQRGLRELRLWVDAGVPGFQGWGVDKDLGTGIWYPSNNSWYWSDMIQTIPATGLRLFVTTEMSSTPPSTAVNYYVQLKLPTLLDNNNDGLFDVGDQGVFVVSGNNGPTDAEIANIAGQTISYGNMDVEGPKVVLTNLYDNQVLTDTSFLLRGQARDQGNSASEFVKIRISKEGQPQGDWQDVEILTNNYSTWQYQWDNITNGVYTIELMARDFLGHAAFSRGVIVSANVSTEVSATRSTVTVDKAIAKADGVEEAIVTVNLLDNDNQPIKTEIVYLNQVINGSNVVIQTKGSGLNGVAVFSVKATKPINANFQVTALNMNIGNQFSINFIDPATSIDYTDGTWIKIKTNPAVYFLDKNNVRHAYPVEAVWASYFGNDFSKVAVISDDSMANYNLGLNVPFKTGTLMKIPSVPKVYKVEDRTIRWVTTEAAAIRLFGSTWAKTVKTIPESFYTDYKVGANIE